MLALPLVSNQGLLCNTSYVRSSSGGRALLEAIACGHVQDDGPATCGTLASNRLAPGRARDRSLLLLGLLVGRCLLAIVFDGRLLLRRECFVAEACHLGGRRGLERDALVTALSLAVGLGH